MAYHILPGISLQALINLFSQSPNEMARWEPVIGDKIPNPYRDLLVHRSHMTSTLEQYHNRSVFLTVLEESKHPRHYARKTLLGLEESGQYVQFAVMRVEAHRCAAPLWDAIVAGQLPMGRILRENNVCRRVRPEYFLKVTPGPELMQHFQLAQPVATYGRLATIYWDDQPTVRVLEVVSPLNTSGTLLQQTADPTHQLDMVSN